MSTSAADYYKVSYLRQVQEEKEFDREFAEEELENARLQLTQAERVVDRCQEELERREEEVAAAKGRVKAAEDDLEASGDKLHANSSQRIVDPNTGLPEGGKIPMTEEHIAYVANLCNVRELMSEGRVEEAMQAEKISTQLRNSNEYELNPRARFLSPDMSITQVCHAGFVNPRTLPKDDACIARSLSYARELYEKGDGAILRDPKRLISLLGHAGEKCVSHNTDSIFFQFQDMLGMVPKGGVNIPDGVNASIVADAFEEIKKIKIYHKEVGGGNNDDNNDGNNDGNSDDGEEETNGEDFEMTDMGWSAVENAIRNQVSKRREANAKELELPCQESSKIARYNNEAHFQFKSDEAISSVDSLLDTLITCKLRLRPEGYCKEEPGKTEIPFQFRTFNNSCFDIEGDLIACCGDEYHNRVREEKNFVGYQNVPVPTNLDQATTLCEVKDASGSNEPWDTNTVCCVYKGRGNNWFENCIADADNNLVWAACSRTGAVHAYSTNDSASPMRAKLSFPAPIVKAHNKRIMGPFSLTRFRNLLIGSSMTGHLTTWDIKSSLEEFEATGVSSEPKNLLIDECRNFLCGDVQPMGSHLIIAPYREFLGNETSSNVRIYDVGEEKVAGLLVGTTGMVSVGRQYCVDSHNTLFVMSDRVGVVFDVRTHKPGVALHTDTDSQQILGVPTESTPVAFTFGENDESIECWDIRFPGSHCYSMATGNTTVDTLCWHSETSSLIASTSSKHVLKYGRYTTTYMYGEECHSDIEDQMERNEYWPRGAVHDEMYFRTRWHCNCQHSHIMLQYLFNHDPEPQDGKPKAGEGAKALKEVGRPEEEYVAEFVEQMERIEVDGEGEMPANKKLKCNENRV